MLERLDILEVSKSYLNGKTLCILSFPGILDNKLSNLSSSLSLW